MAKKEKDNSRPRFECPKCQMIWVPANLAETSCIICGIKGIPLNRGADKLLRKERVYHD